jgi:hypothetical protein
VLSRLGFPFVVRILDDDDDAEDVPVGLGPVALLLVLHILCLLCMVIQGLGASRAGRATRDSTPTILTDYTPYYTTACSRGLACHPWAIYLLCSRYSPHSLYLRY